MTALTAHDEIATPIDDYSQSFSKMRSQLVNSQGVRYADFVRGLRPLYWRVHLDIGLRYAASIGVLVLTCIGQARGVPLLLLVPPAAFLVALLSPAVHLHEAAHWNIAPDRSANDVLCNVLISWI